MLEHRLLLEVKYMPTQPAESPTKLKNVPSVAK